MELKKAYDSQNRIVLIALDSDGVEWARSLPKRYHSPLSKSSLLNKAKRLEKIYWTQQDIYHACNRIDINKLDEVKKRYLENIAELSELGALFHQKTRQAIAWFNIQYSYALAEYHGWDL